MRATSEWITFQCRCGFKLERVPHEVMADVSRCLGCGATLERKMRPRTSGVTDVRNLR